jgi:hypothetical protein
VDTLLEENDRALWEIVNGDHDMAMWMNYSRPYLM